MSGTRDGGWPRETGHWPGWRAAPWRLRVRRIGEVVVLSIKDMFTDSAPQWAAAVAYYSLLSIFPLLLAAAALASLFVEPEWTITRATRLLGAFIPQGEGRIEELVREALAARGGVGLLSTAALLWSGSRVFGVLTKALNIAYDYDETYGFFKRLLVEVAMLLTAGLVFILALASGPLLGFLGDVLRILPAGQGPLTWLIRESVPALLLFTAFTLFYRLVPRGNPAWRAAGAAAAAATLLFLVAQPVFLGYVTRFGRYNLIYGSLAIVIVLVLWAYVVALIALFGGELAAHIQRMLIEGQPMREVERRHRARAVDRGAGRPEPLPTPPAAPAGTPAHGVQGSARRGEARARDDGPVAWNGPAALLLALGAFWAGWGASRFRRGRRDDPFTKIDRR